VYGAALEGLVATDLLKAFAAKQLAGAGNEIGAGKTVVIGELAVFQVGRTSHSKSRILRELFYQELQIIRIKRTISIKITNDLIWRAGDAGEAGIKCMYFAREISCPSGRYPNQLDPWIVVSVFFHQFVRAIGGTIADDHPLLRLNGLPYKRFQGQSNML